MQKIYTPVGHSGSSRMARPEVKNTREHCLSQRRVLYGVSIYNLSFSATESCVYVNGGKSMVLPAEELFLQAWSIGKLERRSVISIESKEYVVSELQSIDSGEKKLFILSDIHLLYLSDCG